MCLYWSFAVPVGITDSPQDVQLTDEVIESGEVSFECAAKLTIAHPLRLIGKFLAGTSGYYIRFR